VSSGDYRWASGREPQRRPSKEVGAVTPNAVLPMAANRRLRRSTIALLFIARGPEPLSQFGARAPTTCNGAPTTRSGGPSARVSSIVGRSMGVSALLSPTPVVVSGEGAEAWRLDRVPSEHSSRERHWSASVRPSTIQCALGREGSPTGSSHRGRRRVLLSPLTQTLIRLDKFSAASVPSRRPRGISLL